MPEKKQEKPKVAEVKNEQTILYKFGNMIGSIVSSILGTAKVEKPKKEEPKKTDEKK